MKINLAQSAGFCVGVKRALDIAKKTAKESNQVYMLGNIVHNQKVVNEIKKIGIKKVKKLSSGKNKILLVRAHGAPKKTYQEAKKTGYKIVDATCPMVKEIHKIAQSYQKKRHQIIVIGDKKHAEVRGIVGQLEKKAIVIDPDQALKDGALKTIKKAAVVTQSTQNIDTIKKIVLELKTQIKQLKFINTICAPTRKKQDEIKKMPLENDIMLVVGSTRSANTKRLYQISKKINRRTYWLEDEKNLSFVWLKNIKSVGITAGSSTPQISIEKIVKKIKTYAAGQKQQ